ncbi:MAG: M48 family metallopeptidase [Rhodospirillales bacterium]|nr:M48 family metallopeptidase [Rhodospirillales bacterium]
MSRRLFERREFLRVAGLGSIGTLCAACSMLEDMDRGMYDAHKAITQEDLITGQRAIGFHSRSEQIARGNAAMRDITGQYSRLNEQVGREEYSRLRRVFSRVHAVSHFADERWQAVLLPEDSFNAFVTGGTYIAVHKGLMDEVSDDAAVAAVIGHEIGHVAANHIFERQQLISALVEYAVTKTHEPGSGFAYSALNETEADEIGVVYAALAGYSPYAVAGLWGEISRKYGNDWSWFRTHPSSYDRARTTWKMAEIAERHYWPGRKNPNHRKLVNCNEFWCNE